MSDLGSELGPIVEAVLSGRGDWRGIVHGTSWVDVIEECHAIAGGPVVVSTAAVGKRDAKRVLEIGRLYVQHSVVKMNSEWMGSRDLGNVRMHRSHAKVALFGRGLSMMTTANLTRNYRWESYLFSASPVVFDGIVAHLAELEAVGAEPWHGETYYRKALLASFGGSSEDFDAGLSNLAGRLYDEGIDHG